MTKEMLSLQQKDERQVSYVPFGSADPIKLSVRIIQNMVAVPTKTGKTCSESEALRFLMMCQAQRLNPFAGDAYLVGYDSQDGPKFSLIGAHQALLKRAETSSEYEGMESGIIIENEDGSIVEREGDFHLENEKVVGGWARVYRKGRKPTYKRLAIAQRAPKYQTQFWQGNKASEQIVKCSEADALRSTFPTLLGGLYIQGEVDGAADRIVSTVTTSKPIFELPAKTALPQPEEKPEPIDDGEGSDLGPQPTETKAEEISLNPAVILKQAKIHKITEAELLDYMRSTGKLDDSISSLQEASMVAMPSLKWLWENWTKAIEEIKKLKAAQQKAA